MPRSTPEPNSLSNEERWGLVLSVKNMIHKHVVAVLRETHRRYREQTETELTDCCIDKVFRAATLFDASRNLQFTTYATFWIKAGISEWRRRVERRKKTMYINELPSDVLPCILEDKLRTVHNTPLMDHQLPDWNEVVSHIKDGRRRKVVAMRFRDGMKFEDIGNRLGVTRQRAEQIVHETIRSLRDKFGVAV